MTLGLWTHGIIIMPTDIVWHVFFAALPDSLFCKWGVSSPSLLGSATFEPFCCKTWSKEPGSSTSAQTRYIYSRWIGMGSMHLVWSFPTQQTRWPILSATLSTVTRVFRISTMLFNELLWGWRCTKQRLGLTNPMRNHLSHCSWTTGLTFVLAILTVAFIYFYFSLTPV